MTDDIKVLRIGDEEVKFELQTRPEEPKKKYFYGIMSIQTKDLQGSSKMTRAFKGYYFEEGDLLKEMVDYFREKFTYDFIILHTDIRRISNEA
jgi:hypothetical protein